MRARQDAVGERESADSPGKVPLTARLLLRDSLTARRAAAIIAAFTVLITVAGGILERVLDHREYPTIGRGLWFALQTVTTVGYGDVTPKDSVGRFIAAVVMLAGIGFLAVVTASATAALIENEPPALRREGRGKRGAAARPDQSTAGEDRAGSRAASGREASRWRKLTSPARSRPARAASRSSRRRLRARRRCRGAASDARSPGRASSGGSSTATRSTSPSDSRSTRRIASATLRGNGLSPARSARPDTHRAQIAEELRTDSAHLARIDGAIAGTPFFVALVPGYLSYLLQEMRMTLRTAALYGRDPGTLRTSAEMLALRGVHPDVKSAEAALSSVRDTGVPDRPSQRRSWRTWVHSAYLLLVFGGFMSPSTAEEEARGRLRAALSVLVGVGIWITTWVLPVSFMIVMAWGCETHARQLGRRTLLFYDGEASTVLDAIKIADQERDEGHEKRAILRTVALFASIAVPIAFIAYIDHVRKTVGVNWLGALGALVALSVVIAVGAIANRK